MEDYLYGKDLYQPLDETSKDIKDEKRKMIDRKAMSVVSLLFRDIDLQKY